MFENSEWALLIRKLISLTQDEKLKWHVEETIVVAPVGSIEYVLGSIDNDGRPPYFFSIWDPAKNENVAKLESQPVEPEERTGEDAPKAAGQLIPELHSIAFRSASGAPKKLNELLSDLNNLDITF